MKGKNQEQGKKRKKGTKKEEKKIKKTTSRGNGKMNQTK